MYERKVGKLTYIRKLRWHPKEYELQFLANYLMFILYMSFLSLTKDSLSQATCLHEV